MSKEGVNGNEGRFVVFISSLPYLVSDHVQNAMHGPKLGVSNIRQSIVAHSVSKGIHIPTEALKRYIRSRQSHKFARRSSHGGHRQCAGIVVCHDLRYSLADIRLKQVIGAEVQTACTSCNVSSAVVSQS